VVTRQRRLCLSNMSDAEPLASFLVVEDAEAAFIGLRTIASRVGSNLIDIRRPCSFNKKGVEMSSYWQRAVARGKGWA